MSQINYVSDVVDISKSTITIGDEITITYKGYLASNGAESVYVHMGYNENWEEQASVPMKRDKSGSFKAKIKVAKLGTLNFCFKDGWDNWDNNYNSNYAFPISSKKTTTRIATPKVEKTVTTKTAKLSNTKAATTKTAKAANTKAATTKTAKAANTKAATTKTVTPKVTSSTEKKTTSKTSTKVPAKTDTKTKTVKTTTKK
jgi:hypothetical protein